MLNHGAVVALLADEVETARAAGTSIGVALVDIDNFRLLNDTHGHEAGDEVLTQVAALLAREPEPGPRRALRPGRVPARAPGRRDAPTSSSSVERLRRGIAELTSSSASRRACR